MSELVERLRWRIDTLADDNVHPLLRVDADLLREAADLIEEDIRDEAALEAEVAKLMDEKDELRAALASLRAEVLEAIEPFVEAVRNAPTSMIVMASVPGLGPPPHREPYETPDEMTVYGDLTWRHVKALAALAARLSRTTPGEIK